MKAKKICRKAGAKKNVGYQILHTMEIALMAFVALVALVNATVFVQTKLMGKTLPQIFGYSYVNILSGSMEPTLSAGDLVICKEMNEYAVGDPVLFYDEGSLVLHRIVDVEQDGNFVTRGDANNADDKNTVKPQNVCGVAVKILPKWGTALTYMTTSTGAIWMLAALFFFYLALDFGKQLFLEDVCEAQKAQGHADASHTQEDSFVAPAALAGRNGKEGKL